MDAGNVSSHNNHLPSTNSGWTSYAMKETFLVGAFFVFSGIIVLLFLLCVFAIIRRRLFLQNSLGTQRSSWFNGFSSSREDPSRVDSNGLEAHVLEALPTFAYTSQKFKDEGLECAVCLCEFQEGEKARLLPNCKHTFHIQCIDMWFRTHSHCPLCRTSVQPEAEISDLQEFLHSREEGEGAGCSNIGLQEGKTSGALPHVSIDISSIRPDSLSSAREGEEVNLPNGSQSSRFSRSHSLKRILSRGRDC
uniref:RING-type E3 ubiquitin transferase n=1 Tax=Araucaria cunninghamii TaxID=56994 RepID=A0A0D6QTG8_ARACU